MLLFSTLLFSSWIKKKKKKVSEPKTQYLKVTYRLIPWLMFCYATRSKVNGPLFWLLYTRLYLNIRATIG